MFVSSLRLGPKLRRSSTPKDLFQHLLDLPLDDERVIYAEVCIQKARKPATLRGANMMTPLQFHILSQHPRWNVNTHAVWFGGEEGSQFLGVSPPQSKKLGLNYYTPKITVIDWEGVVIETLGATGLMTWSWFNELVS